MPMEVVVDVVDVDARLVEAVCIVVWLVEVVGDNWVVWVASGVALPDVVSYNAVTEAPFLMHACAVKKPV